MSLRWKSDWFVYLNISRITAELPQSPEIFESLFCTAGAYTSNRRTYCKWDKVCKHRPSKIYGRRYLKNLKWYNLFKQTISLQIFKKLFSINFTWFILEYLVTNLLSHNNLYSCKGRTRCSELKSRLSKKIISQNC